MQTLFILGAFTMSIVQCLVCLQASETFYEVATLKKRVLRRFLRDPKYRGTHAEMSFFKNESERFLVRMFLRV